MRIGWTLRITLLLIIATVTTLLHFDSEAAERIETPGGFRLGSTLDEAKQHATTRGSQLVNEQSFPPDHWFEKEADITILVCNNIVAGVVQDSNVDFEHFARFVFDLETRLGKPETQIMYVMAGQIPYSSINTRFPEVDGITIAVQFGRWLGKFAMSTKYYSDGVKCNNE